MHCRFAEPGCRTVQGVALRPSLAGIADSNTAEVMDILLLWVLCFVR